MSNSIFTNSIPVSLFFSRRSYIHRYICTYIGTYIHTFNSIAKLDYVRFLVDVQNSPDAEMHYVIDRIGTVSAVNDHMSVSILLAPMRPQSGGKSSCGNCQTVHGIRLP